MELLGKRTLVNGGSRGIGAAIAIALAEKGADVAFTYQRSADRAASVVKTIEEKAGAGSPFRPIVPTRTHSARRGPDGRHAWRAGYFGQ